MQSEYNKCSVSDESNARWIGSSMISYVRLHASIELDLETLEVGISFLGLDEALLRIMPCQFGCESTRKEEEKEGGRSASRRSIPANEGEQP